jgi:hypothetical protein
MPTWTSSVSHPHPQTQGSPPHRLAYRSCISSIDSVLHPLQMTNVQIAIEEQILKS